MRIIIFERKNMKRIFLILMVCLVYNWQALYAQINTPAASPAATVSQTVGLAKVSIEYSRPMLKGRQMIGTKVIPYGKVWRTGANKIPNLTISDDIQMEGRIVKAGTYGFVTIPGEKSWTIILSSNPNQWGTYNYKPEEDVLRFEVAAVALINSEEQFTFGFNSTGATTADLFFKWEKTAVFVHLSHDAEASIMKEIAEKTSAGLVTSDTYYDAANYYYENGKDLKVAYEWADKLVCMDKQYWTYYVRAKIAAKLGYCDVALADARAGLELAMKENDAAYIENHQKVIQQCTGK